MIFFVTHWQLKYEFVRVDKKQTNQNRWKNTHWTRKVIGTIKKWVSGPDNTIYLVFIILNLNYVRLIVSSQIKLSQKMKDGLLMWLITG